MEIEKDLTRLLNHDLKVEKIPNLAHSLNDLLQKVPSKRTEVEDSSRSAFLGAYENPSAAALPRSAASENEAQTNKKSVALISLFLFFPAFHLGEGC